MTIGWPVYDPTPASAMLGGLSPELGYEIADVNVERVGDLEDLDEVKPPLAPLVLGYEGLRTTERVGKLGLGQTLGVARID
jgi:hypothetical protein